jgi:SAM-dependent methyltransferase
MGILKEKLPPDRTFEQIKNHYEVERSLAARLKNSSREERMALYPLLYDELFKGVPDHDRLRRTTEPGPQDARQQIKLRFVESYLDPSVTLVEFGPGDCGFARQISPRLKKVTAVDISDQRSPLFKKPDNFELILYDGFHLEFPDQSADVVFSDQFIEHLHPEDVEEHFRLVNRILRPGGVYIFRTPHAFSGPHDISKYFSATPEGFHLKEWTYRGLVKLLKKLAFSSWSARVRLNRKPRACPALYMNIVEILFKNLPRRPRKFLSRYFLPRKIWMVAVK